MPSGSSLGIRILYKLVEMAAPIAADVAHQYAPLSADLIAITTDKAISAHEAAGCSRIRGRTGGDIFPNYRNHFPYANIGFQG